ncbi:hypothetical protein PMm318_A57390 [Pseudomonas moorei]
MNFEYIRYHIAVTLLVLGSSGLPTLAIVFCINKVIQINEEHLKIAYLTTYIALVLIGLRIYIPRMRGMT